MFAAYAVSFFIIGCIWISHHALFRVAKGVDRSVLAYNLLLLLFVTAIPFTTATYADYATAGGDNARVAVIAYGTVMAGMSISFTLILRQLAGARASSMHDSPRIRNESCCSSTESASVYPVITLWIGMLNAQIMLLLYIPVIGYYFGPGARNLEIGPARADTP